MSTLLPGQEDQPQGILCSSCGRFVGALTRCPHCGARVSKRLSIRVCRYAALLLATCGLGLLYLMATHQEIPMVRIGDVKPTMNFAYVRVVGTVSGDARVFKEGDRIRSLRFMVDDGSGELMVSAFQAQARKLAEDDRVPRIGDRVEVVGSLSVTADEDVVMRLQVADQLVLTRAEMPMTPLGEIAAASAGKSIMIEGTIGTITAPRAGSKAPWAVEVKDSTGTRRMTLWRSVYDELPDKTLLAPGALIRARTSVKSYRNEIQLSLDRGADLQFPATRAAGAMVAGPGAPKTEAKTVSVGEVTPDLAGQMVQVTGQVSAMKEPAPGSKAPCSLTLKDGDKQIEVVYWETVAAHLKDNKPVVGAKMTVRGVVGTYKEKLQIKVGHADDLKMADTTPAAVAPIAAPPVPSAAPTAAPAAAKEMQIGSITMAMTGTTVAVKGKLGDPTGIKGGEIYPLTDSSGTIKLLLWDRVMPVAERDKLTAGCPVSVSGKILEYKGSLEIVPQNRRSFTVQ